MRCDVNVSVKPVGRKELGTKVEVKNMNSFSGMAKAIDHEIERQARGRCSLPHLHTLCSCLWPCQAERKVSLRIHTS